MLRKLTSLLVAAAFSLSGLSQVPKLESYGGTDSLIILNSLKIDVVIAGPIARTSVEMVFCNLGERELEATLVFPLPSGATVTGFALDVEGKLRDAVPVEKQKATQVFESIENRKVDPGLLENVGANMFRTRVYPVPAKGCRTIRVDYEERLLIVAEKEFFQYFLPLNYQHLIPEFALNIRIAQSSEPPLISQDPGRLTFQQDEADQVASISQKDFPATSDLKVYIKQVATTQVFMNASGDKYYFLINTVVPLMPWREHPLPRNIGILWDASLSGLKRNRTAELEFLDSYFKKNKDCIVDLTFIRNDLRSGGRFGIKNGDWSKLKQELEAVVYDGCTDLSAVSVATYHIQEFILFSDGMSTCGELNPINAGKPVHTVVSSFSANTPYLESTARLSLGKFIDLRGFEPRGAAGQLTLDFFNVKKVTQGNKISEVFHDSYGGNVYISGFSDANEGYIDIQFGYGSTITHEKRIHFSFAQKKTEKFDVERIWAAAKIKSLLGNENNDELVKQLGLRYSIVTPNTSLLVLETIEDYIRYEIEPPPSLREEYLTKMKEKKEEEEAESFDYKNSLTRLTEWWKGKKVIEKPDPPVRSTATVPQAEMVQPSTDVMGDYSTDTSYVTTRMRQMSASVTLSEVVVTGFSSRKTTNSESIYVKEWNPERPYLKAMAATVPQDYYLKYLELRDSNASSPTFYFDMASFFMQKEQKDLAIRILGNIAELGIEEHQLFLMLGFRLKEWGLYHQARFAFSKVLKWRSHEPQSYRHYALALEDAGRYQEAADMFYKGLTKEYESDIVENFEGIEEVMLTEFNHLLDQHPQIRKGEYKKEMLGKLPVDIRVVLNWNTNNSDLDLWMTDPVGDTAYYANKETKLGAIISEDQVTGYGPEQIMMRKAARGRYRIEIDFFGDDQVKLIGPTTILVEIFTHYGTREEKRRLITLQMEKSEDTDDAIYVGEFNF